VVLTGAKGVNTCVQLSAMLQSMTSIGFNFLNGYRSALGVVILVKDVN
jgi:hypothetical protein